MQKYFLIALLLFTLVACKQQPQNKTPRYVITSPEVAEIIAHIQGTKYIAGVTDECTYPSALQSITKVGKFGSLDKEKILALQPTLVFTSGLEQAGLAAELEKLGIHTFVYYPETLEEMIAGITEIGHLTGAENNAKALTDSMQSTIIEYRNAAQTVKPKVFLEIYNEPLMSASAQSFMGEVLNLAGGENIFPTLERDYARVKAEDVISRNPDIIISFSQVPVSDIKNRRGWENIPAVRNNRIYTDKDINPDLILRAGPRILQGMKALHNLMQETNAQR